MAEGERFSVLGRGWGFPPTFSKATGTVEMVEDEQDVKESLGILLATRMGERILESRYGCDLDRFQFEPLDTTARTYIEELVRDAVLYFEPRIQLESVQLSVDAEAGRLDIDVRYLISAVNRRENLVFPLYLNGVSDSEA